MEISMTMQPDRRQSAKPCGHDAGPHTRSATGSKITRQSQAGIAWRLSIHAFKCFSMLFSCLLLLACVSNPSKTAALPNTATPAFTPVAMPPTNPPPVQGMSNGSLWTDNTSSFWQDVKARRLGDILTITVSEKSEASKKAATKTGRSSDTSADFSFTGLNAGDKVVLDTLKSGYKGKFDTNFTGAGVTSKSDSMTAYMTATIVEVLPNGNFVIRGSRWTKVNEELQQIVLEGVVRPMDISRNNQVLSQNIADAKIFFVGKGPVSEKNHPGWFGKLFDAVNPF
jgi:flagellar L-ring protein FlgH